ncbi:interleukin-27 receptor subunit alpha isoform X3 [Perognathus longimembris pacificus]|uniref:interleukin-27 receptor subunit alpha isoform X3 n=1 Tax=Perognathus longimembris pacificus TaxID=214514 RepID=UPI002019F357|nr:interleukin-27 receptor subunit alpha isoform X3 [Perognathus longimembris pacificus]
MRGTPAALFWPWPKLALLPVVGFLLCRGTRPQGSTGPLQCYGVGPWGDLNCTWEPLGDLGSPSVLHLQSQKYHSNRTQKVAVPAGQHWVTIPRGQLTTADKLLIWGTQADQPLWPQVFVNLETQMRPDAPNLHPDVVFSEDPPLEAFVQWAPPPWPPHKALTCQFHYRSQEMNWTLLEPELKTIPPSPVEIQDLEPATSYNVSGRCRVEEADLWGPWSLVLSFQTPPSGPKDVWVSGNLCEPRGAQEPLLLWKASGLCAEVSYTVWFWLGKKNVSQEGVSCCKLPVPTWAEWASVAAANAIPWAPLTNLSLLCLAPESAPRGVKVRGIARGTELLVTWEPGIGEASEFVVDWSPDGDPQENLSWIRLSPDSFRAVLPVSSSTQTTTLPDLPWGPCELWVTASTKGGQGPPGPSLRLHLPDNTLKWRVLPSVLSLWVLLLLGCGLSLAASRRCLHLRHKVLPRWVWEKVPDPANSHSGQDHIKEVFQSQPPQDLPILEVEEMEPPPVSRPPQASTPLHSGYEKHFLPTPEELGLLRTTRVQVSA